MKKTSETNIILFVLTILSLFASFGLGLLSSSENYYYGTELSIIFIILLFVMFMAELLKDSEEIKTIHLYKSFYKQVIIFPVSLVIIGVIIFFINRGFNVTNLPYLVFPIALIVCSIDFIADTFVYMHKTKVKEPNTSASIILKLIVYPFAFVSIMTLLGQFTSISIWILIAISLFTKVIFKVIILLVLKQKKSVTKIESNE